MKKRFQTIEEFTSFLIEEIKRKTLIATDSDKKVEDVTAYNKALHDILEIIREALENEN